MNKDLNQALRLVASEIESHDSENSSSTLYYLLQALRLIVAECWMFDKQVKRLKRKANEAAETFLLYGRHLEYCDTYANGVDGNCSCGFFAGCRSLSSAREK